MNQNGLFTAVVLHNSQSSVVGLDKGKKITPAEYISQKKPGTSLITNGAFFIMGGNKNLVADFNNGKEGKPLPPAKYKGYSVGPTSLTTKTVDIPSVYKDLYKKYEADDHIFLTSGPDLKKLVDSTVPPEKEINTNAYRLQYWIRDDQGAIIQPRKKTKFKDLSGGMITVNEPNKRAVIVIVDNNTKIVCVYISKRQDGMPINGMKSLINAFMVNYLKGKTIEETKMALNMNSGGSIYIAWVKDGKTQILAAGGLEGNPNKLPKTWKQREVTIMLKYSWV